MKAQLIATAVQPTFAAANAVTIEAEESRIVEDAKQGVARAVKSVIPFTKVVLIAVPHEAFDVVRNESDMGYRVSQLQIDAWSGDELRFIAERGFEALNIEDADGIAVKLAEAS